MLTSARTSIGNAPRLGQILEPSANSFGVLRFLMAFAVLVSHSYLYLFATPEAEPLYGWIGRTLGQCAVQVFFILSGVMVAQSFARSRSVADFALARALRIFPGLLVCVLLTALVLGPLLTSLPPAAYLTHFGTVSYIAKTASLATGSASLPGVFETVPYAGYVNSSLWTLKYEVLCYVGLALAGLAGLFKPRLAGLAAGALALAIVLVFANTPEQAHDFTFVDNLRYFAVFFGTGVLAYLVRDRLVLSGVVLVALFGLFLMLLGTPLKDMGSALFLGYGALWAATKSFGPWRDICNYYDTSYGIYIYAGPVQQALITAFPEIGPPALTVATTLIVLPLAIASWLMIERPALALRERLGRLVPTAPKVDPEAAPERSNWSAMVPVAVSAPLARRAAKLLRPADVAAAEAAAAIPPELSAQAQQRLARLVGPAAAKAARPARITRPLAV